MKSVVLATDGSPSAAEATVRAVELAHALDATLVAVCVEHLAIPAYGYYGYADVVSELSKMENKQVDETLSQTRTIAELAGVPCEVVHAAGAIAEEICEIAARRQALLIVIGAHGWGPVRRLLHGSVSNAVLHDAPCPVLVVRSKQEAAAVAAGEHEHAEQAVR